MNVKTVTQITSVVSLAVLLGGCAATARAPDQAPAGLQPGRVHFDACSTALRRRRLDRGLMAAVSFTHPLDV